jgi:Lar family restriction alleviation protein
MDFVLKSCPFCKSKNVNIDVVPVLPGYDPYYGHCRDCGSQGPRKNTISEAVEAWNKRSKNKHT